jgi:hypothetical protein
MRSTTVCRTTSSCESTASSSWKKRCWQATRWSSFGLARRARPATTRRAASRTSAAGDADVDDEVGVGVDVDVDVGADARARWGIVSSKRSQPMSRQYWSEAAAAAAEVEGRWRRSSCSATARRAGRRAAGVEAGSRRVATWGERERSIAIRAAAL